MKRNDIYVVNKSNGEYCCMVKLDTLLCEFDDGVEVWEVTDFVDHHAQTCHARDEVMPTPMIEMKSIDPRFCIRV